MQPTNAPMLSASGGQGLLECDVRDGDATAGLEYAVHLTKDRVFDRRQVDHAIGDQDVRRVVGER